MNKNYVETKITFEGQLRWIEINLAVCVAEEILKVIKWKKNLCRASATYSLGTKKKSLEAISVE